jgi:hypothetical protein
MLYPLSYEGLRRPFAQHAGRVLVRWARAGCVVPDGLCRICAACDGPASLHRLDTWRRLYGGWCRAKSRRPRHEVTTWLLLAVVTLVRSRGWELVCAAGRDRKTVRNPSFVARGAALRWSYGRSPMTCWFVLVLSCCALWCPDVAQRPTARVRPDLGHCSHTTTPEVAGGRETLRRGVSEIVMPFCCPTTQILCTTWGTSNRWRRPDQQSQTWVRMGPQPPGWHRRNPDLNRTRHPRPQPGKDGHPRWLTTDNENPERPLTQPPDHARADQLLLQDEVTKWHVRHERGKELDVGRFPWSDAAFSQPQPSDRTGSVRRVRNSTVGHQWHVR